MNISYKYIFQLIVWMAVSTSLPLSAQVESYLPLTQAELSNQFPLRYYGTLEKPEHLIHMIGTKSLSTIQISMTDEMLVRGQDDHHMPWRVHLQGKSYLSQYSLVYTADFDLNGYEDLLLLLPTGGNGLAPTTHLVTLLFDPSGRPLPFAAEGYWQYDEQGMTGFLDLDHNGTAELIAMHLADGYWITNLYTAHTARWQKISGAFMRRHYPLFTRFTDHPNRQAEALPTTQQPFSPDVSNARPQHHGQLIEYQWADIAMSEDIRFTLLTEQGDTVVCSPVSWYASFTVVIDTAERREITSLSAPEHRVKMLFDEILAQEYVVSVYGQRSADDCSPELLWAQPRSFVREH